MANKRKKEVCKAPITCYTTESYKEKVSQFVETQHPGMTLSAFVRQLVLKAVPIHESEEVTVHHA